VPCALKSSKKDNATKLLDWRQLWGVVNPFFLR